MRSPILLLERLCNASLIGNVDSLEELMAEDPLTLDRAGLENFPWFNGGGTPLHLAAAMGHVGFARALLKRKPDWVTGLDCRLRSPLHLASANGHVKVVKLLLKANISVCLFEDGLGHAPLHIAAKKGHVAVVKELVSVKPELITCNLNGLTKELHMYVIRCGPKALDQLVETDCNFLNGQDDNGNTILHTATCFKDLEIVRCLVTRDDVRVDVENAKGLTALDIINNIIGSDTNSAEITRLLVSARDAKGQSERNNQQVQLIAEGKHMKEKNEKRLEKKRDAILVAATVIASMAYQAGLNPPGGVWQEDKHKLIHGHNLTFPVGTSIMAFHREEMYLLFWKVNTLSFVASLCTILLLISGLHLNQRIFMWFLTSGMGFIITLMGYTYFDAVEVITPKVQGFDYWHDSLIHTRDASASIWMGLTGIILLVHTSRFIMWIIKNVVKCSKRTLSNKANQSGYRRPSNV